MLPERRVFQEWSRNRYGVFPESGFAGDARYPDFYTDDDGEVRANEDCDGLVDIDRSDHARNSNSTGDAVSLSNQTWKDFGRCLSVVAM